MGKSSYQIYYVLFFLKTGKKFQDLEQDCIVLGTYEKSASLFCYKISITNRHYHDIEYHPKLGFLILLLITIIPIFIIIFTIIIIFLLIIIIT